ncbi:MAG TPA: BatA and WFA domain-containing protein [Candidatus Binataceae bacterium]|nr:BatA and WFA domain-containing protein [Candidatus Binataceae bacterium]
MGLFDAFGLLYPAALYLFAIPPLLLIAYLARERPRQVVVSSVMAFRALHSMRGERFGGRPRVDWTFLVELLILCLAVLAIAGPYMIRQGNPIAVVVDNSAAMQALTESGQSRFQILRHKLADAIRAQAGGEITVYATAPQPHDLGGAFATAGEAISAIDRLAVTDSPDDPAALASLLSQLATNRRLGRIIVGGYRPIASPVPARMMPIVAGFPIANYAIGSFALSRESFGAAALHGRVNVANFSPAGQVLTVTIAADGKPVGRAQARVDPGEVAALDFPNLAPARVFRAQLEPADAFPLDNTAYATGSAVRGVSILFVSPVPADASGLRTIPGVSLDTVAPASYAPAQLASADLAIFEYTVPKELPAVNSLLVMPPPGDPVFGFEVRRAQPLELTAWPSVDPLTDGVNFRLLNMRSGQYFTGHPWMHEVIGGAGGALMLSGSRQGHRFVATGFNPFPYYGRENLPMSILTLNMLSYLAGFGAQGSGLRTGEPWIVPAGIKEVVLPSGRKQPVQAGGPFTLTTAQGIYTLIGAGRSTTVRAVNLADLTTSDLESVPPLRIESSGGAQLVEQAAVRTSLTPWLIGAIIGLVLLESLLVYRRRRPAVGVVA